MKGMILAFDYKKEVGVLRDADGNRYEFTIEEWCGQSFPTIGHEIDFLLEEGKAKDIYPLVKTLSIAITEKSKATTTLLSLFLGGIGAHKFYMGSWGWGIIYIILCWTYIPFLVSLAESVRYILLTDHEFSDKSRDTQAKGYFGFLW